MRILFTCYPANVHVYPLTPVATALQHAGHEVLVGFHDHPGIRGSIERVGLTPVPLGDSDEHDPRFRKDAAQLRSAEEVLAYAKAMNLSDKDLEHWIPYFQQVSCGMSDYGRPDLPYATDLVNFARSWKPDLVIWDPVFGPAGAVAARVCGAAHARFLGPCLDWPAYFHYKLEAARAEIRAAGLVDNPMTDLIRPLADKYGVWVDDELLFGQWTIDPLPEGIRMPTTRPKVPVRWVPYAYPEPLPDWLVQKPEKPRVTLSLGESLRRFVDGDWGRTPKIFEAVADMEIELVATVNEYQLRGVERIPPNVRVIDWVPINRLLPTSSLHIHHGGNGTTLAAVANKVPHIVTDTDESMLMESLPTDESSEFVVKSGTDFGVVEDAEPETTFKIPAKHVMGPIWAEHVTKYGAGIRLNYQKESVEEIRTQIDRVLTDTSFQKGARTLYNNWLGTPTPSQIVPIIEQLTAENRPAA